MAVKKTVGAGETAEMTLEMALLKALGVESMEAALEKVTAKSVLAGADAYPTADDSNMTEKVIVNVPLNPMNPLDIDITVGLNGVIYKIKRGEDVEVPKAVAEVLQHSAHQKAAAIRYQNSIANGSV